jgi:hypothetical protein
MLKIKTFVGMGLLAGATIILAQDAPWLNSNRAGNVYYAAQASNWGLPLTS